MPGPLCILAGFAFLAVGIPVLWIAIKNGVFEPGYERYERRRRPVAFWFSITAHAVCLVAVVISLWLYAAQSYGLISWFHF